MLDRRKLAAVLSRLDSTHEGEVLNAARAAVQMVKDSKLTWDAVLAPPKSKPAASPRPVPVSPVEPFPGFGDVLKTVREVAKAVKAANTRRRS